MESIIHMAILPRLLQLKIKSNDIIFNSERWFSFLTPKYKEFESEAAPAKCQNKAGALFIDDVPVRARTLKSHFCRQGT